MYKTLACQEPRAMVHKRVTHCFGPIAFPLTHCFGPIAFPLTQVTAVLLCINARVLERLQSQHLSNYFFLFLLYFD